jgi:hypothetical protein
LAVGALAILWWQLPATYNFKYALDLSVSFFGAQQSGVLTPSAAYDFPWCAAAA